MAQPEEHFTAHSATACSIAACFLVCSYTLNTTFILVLWRRKRHPAPGLLPGEFHGQRSLADNSPWGHKESDATE